MEKWVAGGSAEPRSQRRRTGAGGEADLEQVKQLAVSAAELALSKAATVRVHDAALLRTWMPPASSQYAVAGLQAGKGLSRSSVTSAGRSHGLGSPHLHVWASLAVTAKSDPSLKETEKAEVTTHANAITDPKELEAMVLVCNMRPAYNKEWARVQLEVEQPVEPIAQALEAAFRNVGGEQKHGTGPRGPLERKVTELLEGMGVKLLFPMRLDML